MRNRQSDGATSLNWCGLAIIICLCIKAIQSKPQFDPSKSVLKIVECDCEILPIFRFVVVVSITKSYSLRDLGSTQLWWIPWCRKSKLNSASWAVFKGHLFVLGRSSSVFLLSLNMLCISTSLRSDALTEVKHPYETFGHNNKSIPPHRKKNAINLQLERRMELYENCVLSAFC